jgi:hypothetical protein
LDQELNQAYLCCRTPQEKSTCALGGLANLLLWLGWLWSSETFCLEWRNLLIVEPDDSASMDLPDGCGMISCRLAAETKSCCSHQPDVTMAYKTLSGFHLGELTLKASFGPYIVIAVVLVCMCPVVGSLAATTFCAPLKMRFMSTAAGAAVAQVKQ